LLPMRGVIVDVDHDLGNREQTIIRLYVRGEDGSVHVIRKEYTPYFYVLSENPEDTVQKIRELSGVKSAEIVERFVRWEKKRVILVRVAHQKYINRIREKIKEMGGECREHDINVERKFLYEHGLEPLGGIDTETLSPVETRVEPVIAAFDLEVYAKDRMPEPDRPENEIIMASWVDSTGRRVVITTKDIERDYVVKVETEAQIISELNRLMREVDPDIVLTYNGDNFDLPYLRERARFLGMRIPWGRDGSEPRIRRGPTGNTTVDIAGRAHVDVFQIVQFMAGIGAINSIHLDLESVYEAVLGKKKVKIKHMDIADQWRSGDLGLLADYNLQDSIACYELGMEFLPLYVELSRITVSPLPNTTRMSASQLVEWTLIRRAFKMGKVVPRKPREEEVRARMMETYQGAFVKEPVPGLHERIVVLDFRSLYPTIIISHNVDPDTANAPYCSRENAYVSPVGHYFCKEPKGLIPGMLEEVLELRFALKDKLKKMDKDDPDYKPLYAKQKALKIVANATYGYLGFARARWYCKVCAEAVTAWARHYIKKVMKWAEEHGFTVIYGDTDSVFIKLGEDQTLEDALAFMGWVNERLPKPMALDFDGYYVRGIFLSKRRSGKAAKKKYALIDKKGRLKITGLEYVRRDWAEIAKEVQAKVLEYVLKEGDVKKAVDYVKRVIADVRAGKIPKEKLIIYTQIQKELDRYAARGPHVAAALKAMKRGVHIEPGMIIGYIITKRGSSISDKAELAQFVREGDYDPEYYVEHQIIPAVLPILEELGYDERALKQDAGQRSIFDFT